MENSTENKNITPESSDKGGAQPGNQNAKKGKLPKGNLPRDNLLKLDFRTKLFEFLLQLFSFFFFQAFFDGFRRTVDQVFGFFQA